MFPVLSIHLLSMAAFLSRCGGAGVIAIDYWTVSSNNKQKHFRNVVKVFRLDLNITKSNLLTNKLTVVADFVAILPLFN